ncbi:MAG TPA: hypothetical protein VMM78_11555, partial [Thermomicrobiales bacterium]|nr:hypothetical protein [Thermomicrobiales bacterium]
CDGTGLVNARHELVTAYGAGTPVVDSAPAHDTVVNREPLRPYPVQSTETPDWTLPWAGLIVAIIGVPAAIAVVSRRRYR